MYVLYSIELFIFAIVLFVFNFMQLMSFDTMQRVQTILWKWRASFEEEEAEELTAEETEIFIDTMESVAT